MQEYPIVHEGTWSTCIFLFIENFIISVKKVRICHMKQIYHMQKISNVFWLHLALTSAFLAVTFCTNRGHSKCTFVVQGGGPYKANENEQGDGVVKLICTFALWKKIAWFFKQQTRVLSDKFLGSCSKFCCFESKT